MHARYPPQPIMLKGRRESERVSPMNGQDHKGHFSSIVRRGSLTGSSGSPASSPLLPKTCRSNDSESESDSDSDNNNNNDTTDTNTNTTNTNGMRRIKTAETPRFLHPPRRPRHRHSISVAILTGKDPGAGKAASKAPGSSSGERGGGGGLGFLRRFSRAHEDPLGLGIGVALGLPVRPLSLVERAELNRRAEAEAMSCGGFAALHAAFAPSGPMPASADALLPRICVVLRGSEQEQEEDEQDKKTDGARGRGEPDQDQEQTGREPSGSLDEDNQQDSGDDELDLDIDFLTEHSIGVRRLSRETTASAEDLSDVEELDELDLDDDNEGEEEDKPQLWKNAQFEADEDLIEGFEPDEQADELSFDAENMDDSVLTLVRKIESLSVLQSSGSIASSRLSNQDADEMESDGSDGSDGGRLSGRTSRCDSSGRVDSDSLPAASHAKRGLVARIPTAHPAGIMRNNCYIPLGDVQDELTMSVRRLVIGLKVDAEGSDSMEAHNAPFARRCRGGSCPSSYEQPRPSLSLAETEAAATIAAFSLDSPGSCQPKWRKKSALARLAPKLLDPFRRKRKSYLLTDAELVNVHGSRWKMVELAYRYGGEHRFYLANSINNLGDLVKYGRRGEPHNTRLHCNRCGSLQWQQKRGGLSRAVDLADVLQVIEGRRTAVFRKFSADPDRENRSLSIIFKERTLDIETKSSHHRDWLMTSLRTLIAYARKQREAEAQAIAEHAAHMLDEKRDETKSTSSVCSEREAVLLGRTPSRSPLRANMPL